MLRSLASLAVPSIVSQLIILIYNLADTFFIGRTGNPLMVAGASLILPVFNVSISLASIAGEGGASLISRLLGSDNYEEAGKVSSFSFWLTVLIAALFSSLTYAFLDPLLRLLGASGDTLLYARQYTLCVIVGGGIPTVVSMSLGRLLRGAGKAKLAGFGVSMGGILNIALDPLFMFVLLPEGCEILGAGIATMLSNVIVCIFFLINIFSMRRTSVLSLSPLKGLPVKASVASIFAVGVPAAIGTLLFDLDYVVIDRLMAGYSDVALAAIGIVLKAERLPLNIGVGLCIGMAPLIGYNYAAGNHERVRKTINCARLTGICIGLVSITLYEIFAPQIMTIFIPDAETVRIGTSFLRIRAAATVFMFLCFVIVHVFQAIGKGGYAFWLQVLRWAVFNIPMLFILNKAFGMYGITASQAVCDTCVAAISQLVYRLYRKRRLAQAPAEA